MDAIGAHQVTLQAFNFDDLRAIVPQNLSGQGS